MKQFIGKGIKEIENIEIGKGIKAKKTVGTSAVLLGIKKELIAFEVLKDN